MGFQTVFKRYELKYMITKEQQNVILQAMSPFMEPDKYGRTTIRNIYFDTPDFRLIRHSIEKPVYKEKIRIRCYEKAGPDTKVFVELKKKYDHVVYKRRLSLSEAEAINWVNGIKHCKDHSQISKEIDYFMNYYRNLRPTLFLSYEREAYYSKTDKTFRVTFDKNILCRQNDLSLKSGIYGEKVLDDQLVLMEIKCTGGIPLWVTGILSQEHIYKTSFSKYGTAYTRFILPKLKEKKYERFNF